MTTYVLNAIGTGIYGDSGSSGSTTAPFVGRETFPTDVSGVWTAGEFDAFWSFDLSGVHGTITGLTLRVPGFDYFGSDSWFDQLDFTLDGSELMNFWAVSASTSNLLGFPQGMAALEIFNDLHSGSLLGQKNFLEADTNLQGFVYLNDPPSRYEIPLNSNAVFFANGQKTTGFSIGADLADLDPLPPTITTGNSDTVNPSDFLSLGAPLNSSSRLQTHPRLQTKIALSPTKIPRSPLTLSPTTPMQTVTSSASPQRLRLRMGR